MTGMQAVNSLLSDRLVGWLADRLAGRLAGRLWVVVQPANLFLFVSGVIGLQNKVFLEWLMGWRQSVCLDGGLSGCLVHQLGMLGTVCKAEDQPCHQKQLNTRKGMGLCGSVWSV